MKKHILPLIATILLTISTITTINLNILSTKLLLLIILANLSSLTIGTILSNKKTKIIGIIIIILNIIINIVATYYIINTNNFIKKNFKGDIKYNTTFYIITTIDNPVNNISELESNITINYYKYSINIEKAIEILSKYNYNEIDKIEVNNYLLIDKNNYQLLETKYKIIYEFNIETIEERNKEVLDSYNIYIGGRDFTNSLMDFNMIITINNKTKKILLTSIPRDYYIETVGYNQKDSLEFMGLLGEKTIMNSLENLFDTKIENYASIYTENLVEIVDKIGGIEYCSDIAFTTTHALVQGTYNDSKSKKLTIKKGCQHLNGIETLTLARERKNVGSDRQRQKNCQQIFEKILEKSLTLTTLTNYTETLESISNLYITNINEKTITNLIKNLINNKYTIEKQSVDGIDGTNYIRLNTVKSYVMYPDINTVEQAKQNIKNTLN